MHTTIGADGHRIGSPDIRHSVSIHVRCAAYHDGRMLLDLLHVCHENGHARLCNPTKVAQL